MQTNRRTFASTAVRRKEVVTTYKRICIEDFTLTDSTGQRLELKRGREYLTSEIHDGGDTVTVLSTYWASVPVSIFAGEKLFTGPGVKLQAVKQRHDSYD